MSQSDDTSGSNGYVGNDAVPPRVHLYEYLMVFARYRKVFLTIVLGGSLLFAAYLVVAKQTFTATATLLPPDKSEGVSLSSLMQSSSKLDFKALSENSSAETFVRILQSRTLADSLITRFNLLKRYEIPAGDRELAIDQVLGDFSISSDRQGFIDISYNVKTGLFPSDAEQRDAAQLSAKIVNNSIELLDKMNQQKSVSRARRSREFIGKMKVIKRAELDSVQMEMLRFQQRNKAIALDKQIGASVEGLSDLQVQIQKTELLLSAAEQELNSETPQVQSLRNQLAELKAQKSRLEGGLAGGEALGIPLRGVPDLMRQLADLKLRLEVATQIYTYLEAQYNQEQIQEARELPTVSVMDYANPPIRRSAPRRTVMMFIVVAALVVFATVVIFLLEAYRKSWADLDKGKRLQLRQVMGRRSKERSTTDIS
ncbi:MAG: hypothetical protein JST22_16820 [Bacteroidetes bacterium]|nr:hypothetical protein [Bacteroidota bacterium]